MGRKDLSNMWFLKEKRDGFVAYNEDFFVIGKVFENCFSE